MAELHEALKNLAPVNWTDVPQDNLAQYLSNCFTAGELICNSVPPNPQGTPFDVSKPHHAEPNQATSHKDMHPSSARALPPHKDHEDLQRHWGKPYKFNQKDNPLRVSIYKMAGHDRHGAWFARRSVHEGLGFNKFKHAMMREFPESLAVTGGPGAGAVRGLSADRRLEQKEVPDVGKLEVYELSAQFPGPVTPRDFMTMLLSSDDALSVKSVASTPGDETRIPRHMMLISRPVSHPDAPERPGLVRGQYESVEMIREIPLTTRKAASTPNLLSNPDPASNGRDRGKTVAVTESSGKNIPPSNGAEAEHLQHDPELNPVEWIMITRSDPGGGLPRFLVERGTPDAMLSDVHRFFNWACSLDSADGTDTSVPKSEANDEGVDTESVTATGISRFKETSATANSPADHQSGGMINNLTNALEAGIDAYAPVTLSHMIHERLHPSQAHNFSDASSDSSSVHSFLSADELQKVTTAPEHPAVDSAHNPGIGSEDVDVSKHSRDLSRHEKDMLKLAQKRERLDQDLEKKRIAEETRLRQAQEKDAAEAARQRDKIQKEIKRMEEKHRLEVEKLEQKKEREARKIEEKRRKKDEQTKLSLVTRERDDFRSQLDIYKRENQLLIEQVEALQLQNTTLTAKLGKLGGGEALRGLNDSFSRSRTPSVKSRESADSMARSIDKKVEGISAS